MTDAATGGLEGDFAGSGIVFVFAVAAGPAAAVDGAAGADESLREEGGGEGM